VEYDGGGGVTVLAEDVPVQALVLPGHGCGGHLPVHTLPHTGHTLHGQTTGGTREQAALQHVIVAGGVQEV